MEKTTCVIQYDDRDNSTLGTQLDLVDINRRMSVADGASYAFHRKSPHSLPPYWQKVKLAEDALKSGKCSHVIYLDTDAVLRQPPSALVSSMSTDHSFLMSADMAPWNEPFNAGVWVVKDSTAGVNLMSSWMQQYDTQAWSRSSKGWTCATDHCNGNGKCEMSECLWAGSQYEQGAMAGLIADGAHDADIKKVQWTRLQHHCSPIAPDADALTCHFAGHHKKSIPEYLSQQRKIM